jgi:hypothetical protein
VPHSWFIQADPTPINPLLINLCTNAYHAKETKGGTLIVCLTQSILGIRINRFNFHSHVQVVLVVGGIRIN